MRWIGVGVLTTWTGLTGALADPIPASEAATNLLEYVLVVTGGEILHGSVQDAHTAFLARTLLPLGAVCVGVHMVDDLDDDLRQAVATASRRAPLVLVTGGLGPTLNDITRDTLSACTGIALREDPDLVNELARRLRVQPAAVPDNLRRQARVPVRGGHLPNANGTAVGLIFDAQPAVIIALPGPPRELQPLARDALVPWLRTRYGLRHAGCSLTLRFIGLGQSRIDQVLRDKVPLPSGLVVGSVFEGSRVDFTFSLPHDDAPARAQLADLETAVRRELDDAVYATGTNTLESAALASLHQAGLTLALAEVGTGGTLGAALSRDPATRSLLAAAFSAPSEDRLRRTLSVADQDWSKATNATRRVRTLAEHARRISGAAWVIAIGEPESSAAGPARLRVVAGGPANRWEDRELELRDSAESGRASLVNAVLDWFRKL